MSTSILYVCNEDRATTKQRLLALQEMDTEIDIVYTYLLSEKPLFLKKVIRALKFRLGFFPERNNENREILKKVRIKKYDIMFVEKGLSIHSATIKEVKRIQPFIKIISYTLDDVMNIGNSSIQYRRSISLYDFHFTNKKYNVTELKSLGAKNVFYFRNAYSSHVHRPVNISDIEKKFYGSDISFIGTYENERAIFIRYLAEHDFKIKIWGWSHPANKTGMLHPNISINNHVYDDEFAKVVCSSAINLCFLRKENRDTETTRSIEIPACGGFMLAERTKEHQELFNEDEEAVYFDTKEELLKKVQLYLRESAIRATIAKKGLERCKNSNYSYQDQLRFILNKTMEDNEISNN